MDASTQALRAEFQEHDRQATIENFKVASILGMILVPSFGVLDFVVYQKLATEFIIVRFACSGLIAIFLTALLSSFGRQHYRWFTVTLVLLPGSAISYMIWRSWDGVLSPYYAGLNLVLLMTGFVLRWTFTESVIAVGMVWLEYLAACYFNVQHPFAFNKVGLQELAAPAYFMGATGIIVVTGNFFFGRARFREFELRFKLRQNQAQLEESNRKLLEMDEIKSRFFANISHELRTPLTLLLAPLESLLQRFSRSLDEDTRNMLLTMHSNGMRLLKLINDLLDLVRLESGRMELKREPVELTDFIKGLSSAARQVADDKRLRLETSVGPDIHWVLVDRDKLEKILLNLVFNALKFTPPGGTVQFRAEKNNDRLLLIVADTGMGISKKNLPFIFDRFWQADGSSKRKYQGVGIGLALVKELTEIQEGTVTVESDEGKGTTFRVDLPFREAPRPNVPPPVEPSSLPDNNGRTVSSEEWLANLYRRAELFPALAPIQESKRAVEPAAGNGHLPTILVADDEPDMLRFLKSQLQGQYRVLEASDGLQAIEKATQFLPDLLLVDMMMPEKDGLQVCRELRERTSTQSLPVIMLTARADEETKMAALSAGANDFLPKPFSTTELHVRIKNLIESHDYQRKLSQQNEQLESAIEQLKETETQLVQTEKLASLGRMSAGIIHEINNPLNFVSTALFSLRKKSKNFAPEQQTQFEEILQDVEEGLKRVKTIVSDLRTFTRPDPESREQVEVADAVAMAMRLVSSASKQQVRFDVDIPDGQSVWANKNKVIQVLVNLMQNSLDALETKTFDQHGPVISIQGAVTAGKSRITVRDNGPGIEDKVRDKIFEPFFTTKEIGKGMGLGLWICYRLVQEFDGRIVVETESGKFSEFTLEFPQKG